LSPREIGFENCRWMEMTKDLVQWGTLVLAPFNVQVLLSET